MKKLYLAFLWHMHQPVYKDFLSGRYFLPWVRLHALKGYYDMPALLKKFPSIKLTFNLTPSLLIQLMEYANNDSVQDDFLEVSKKNAAALTLEDKHFIIDNFFMNNWETIVKSHPRYGQLLRKRGFHYSSKDADRIISRFTPQDFLDLQVLFNLSWFGFEYKKKCPELHMLIAKTEHYSEEDKRLVLHYQRELIKDVIPLYQELFANGNIDLSTTPFYHPILPLVDSGNAKYGYNWSNDVQAQLDKAVVLYEDLFNAKPHGVWPSEGSVSRTIVYPLVQSGMQWIASDEDIVLHSLGGGNREEVIYQPYYVTSGEKKLAMVFRDKHLSDLIGFSYAQSSPEAAADDFMLQLRKIGERVSGYKGEHIVSVILDGENAWEYYRGGGEQFLSCLYERISNDEAIVATSITDFITMFPPEKEIKHLFAGSWINHNFDIWYGHQEDRLAWRLLDETRTFLTGLSLPADVSEKAWEEIYVAEGSDWFWWFGEEFSSQCDTTFDFLFRNHLMNVYRIAGKTIPEDLNNPIKNRAKAKSAIEPRGFINPIIDGKITTFYEWQNAGVYVMDDVESTMSQNSKIVHSIWYGFNMENLFLRLSLTKNMIFEDLQCCAGHVYIATPNDQYNLCFNFKKNGKIHLYLINKKNGNTEKEFHGMFAFGKIVEVSLPFSDLNTTSDDELHLSFSVLRNSMVLEQWPMAGFISLCVPNENYEQTVWSA